MRRARPNPPVTDVDTALLFADLQEGIVQGSRTNPEADIRKSAKALADVAQALRLPTYVNMVQTGPEAPKAIAEIGEVRNPIVRHGAKPFEYQPLRSALLDSRGANLAIAGVMSEIVVLHAALGAIDAGLSVQIVVDACGGMSDRTERAVFNQIERAGGVLTSVATFATTLAGDFTSPEGKAVLAALGPLLGRG